MLIEPTLRSDLLAGQVAIVTGGARGIGGATATSWSRSDWLAPALRCSGPQPRPTRRKGARVSARP